MTELYQQFDGLQNTFSEFPDILEKFDRKRRNWQSQSVITQLIILSVLKIALVNRCFSDKNMIILLSM